MSRHWSYLCSSQSFLRAAEISALSDSPSSNYIAVLPWYKVVNGRLKSRRRGPIIALKPEAVHPNPLAPRLDFQAPLERAAQQAELVQGLSLKVLGTAWQIQFLEELMLYVCSGLPKALGSDSLNITVHVFSRTLIRSLDMKQLLSIAKLTGSPLSTCRRMLRDE